MTGMGPFRFRPPQPEELRAILDIYNADPRFLLHHLGVEGISDTFLVREAATMDSLGFSSCVITEGESREILGVLDYRPGEEVYLSLLLLRPDLRGMGLGREIYTCFEAGMARIGAVSVRLDVVNGYEGHPVPFWLRLGFSEGEDIQLKWGEKRSPAVVMRKYLRNPPPANPDTKHLSL